jgi:hypothetical protein
MKSILLTLLAFTSLACSAEAPTCRPGYELKLSADCAWVETPCDIANGEGLREENGNCRLVRCNNDHHPFGNACAANKISCTVENGSGESTWDGSIYGPCTVNSCSNGYHIESNTCASNTRACNITNGSGSQSWTDSWGQCTLQSCNTGYRVEGNACVLIPVTTALPRFPAAQVTNAASKSGYRFWDDADGSPFSSHAFLGATYSVLAYESFAGNTSTDAKILANMRYTMTGGREPQGAGGYSAQHELHYFVAAVFVKRTPRLWNQLTTAEKAKLDTILKAALVGNAYSCSSENPQIKQNITPIKNIVGDQMWWKNAPNFQNACPAVVMTGYIYFGTTEANNILNNFKKGEFAAYAQSIGLPRIYDGYRLDGPPGDRGGPRPTATEVETAIKNWKWARNGAGGTAYVTHMTRMLELAFDNTVQPGLNNGAGFTINGVSRGKIASNAAGLPNRGALGMANEFDTSDAGGPRSAMSYVTTGTRIVLDMLLLLGALDLYEMTPALKARVDIGMTDIKYKNDNGYLSHSKGGRPSANNEDWTQPRYNTDWGMNYTLGTWFDVIKKMN